MDNTTTKTARGYVDTPEGRVPADLEALRAAAETDTEVGDAGDWTVDDGSTATGMTTMSIRLPTRTLAALKTTAEQLGVGATTLARQWITERLALAPGATPASGTVEIADLMTFLMAHSRTPRTTDAEPSRSIGRNGPVEVTPVE